MPRATSPPPARLLAVFAATVVVATGALLSLGAPRVEAAKPCWERVIDDWVDNGRIEGVYSPSCLTAARKHVPEDIRAYTDIIDKIDSYRLNAVRTLQSTRSPDAKQPSDRVSRNSRRLPEPQVSNGKDEAPLTSVLGKGTTDASSIPVPLMVLAGLALLLMAAGAAGFAQRKLAARRRSSGPS